VFSYVDKPVESVHNFLLKARAAPRYVNRAAAARPPRGTRFLSETDKFVADFCQFR
jgi:hypothetical protein